MEEVYKKLLIELAKAFLAVENAPNAHPQLKAVLKAAVAESLKPPPTGASMQQSAANAITLKKDN